MRKISHSQNFIKNRSLIHSLIQKSTISKNDLVIEIGAGNGEITGILTQYCRQVMAIEKDKKLFKKLSQSLKHLPNLKLFNLDIFKFKFPAEKSYKVFANIPFNHTADIISLLTTQPNPADDLYLFVQKQASLSYAGQPKESLKSLFIKIFFELSIIHQFQRTDFQPVPKVDITLLHFQKLSRPLLPPMAIDRFKDFVVYAFSQTKPDLKQGLARLFTPDQFNQIAKDFNINLKNKPTDLSLEQWLGLFNFFNLKVAKSRKILVNHAYQKLLIEQKSLQKIHRTRTDKHWRKK